MLRLKQTKADNCFQTCVACLFELPIEAVPECTIASRWNWKAFQRWLNGYGLYALEVDNTKPVIQPSLFNIPCIGSGYTTRGKDTLHAVVGKWTDGFYILHDPFPDNSGLTDLQSIIFFGHLDYGNKIPLNRR